MIIKFLKYEYGTTIKTMLPFYITIIAAAIINSIIAFTGGISSPSLSEDMTFLGTFVFFASNIIGFFMILIFGMTFYILVKRHINSMYGNEGYLTNTLPIKTSKLILIKFLNFWVWILTSLLIMIFVSWTLLGSDIITKISQLYYFLNLGYIRTIIYTIYLFFIYSNPMMLLIFSIAFANIFSNFKIVIGIVTYFLIQIAWLSTVIPLAQLILDTFKIRLYGDAEVILSDIILLISFLVLYFSTVYIHKNYLNIE